MTIKNTTKVLAIISEKGGCGKTTCAIGIAVAAARNGQSVALIDIDKQTSATNWSDRRGETGGLSVVSCQPSRLPRVLQAAKESGANLVIVDCPGKTTEAAIAAAKVADFVLIPVKPDMMNLETLTDVRDVLTIAGNKPSAVVITLANIQGTRHKEAREYAKSLGFQTSPVVIFNRAAHADAANIGQTAQDYDNKGKAALEMQELYDYINKEIVN